MAALNIKNIPTGAGDDIKVDVSYAKGRHQERDRDVIHVAELRHVRSSGRAYQSIGFGATTDGVYLPGMTNGIELTDAYGVRGAFTTIGIRIGRRASTARRPLCGYDGAAKAAYCATYVGSNKLTAANTSAISAATPTSNVYRWSGHALDTGQEPDFLRPMCSISASTRISPAPRP